MSRAQLRSAAMRWRARKIIVSAFLLLAAATGLAACSSTVVGSGTGSLPASSAASSTSAAPTTASSAASSASHNSSAPASKSSSAPSTTTSSAAPLGPATLLSLTNTSPACGASTVDQTFVLSWTSKNATEVWIEDSEVAVGLTGADPKTDGNGTQLTQPSKGNLTISYPCSDTTDPDHYYLLEVYNTSNATMSGQDQQVPRG
jgi:hypothetical protein